MVAVLFELPRRIFSKLEKATLLVVPVPVSGPALRLISESERRMLLPTPLSVLMPEKAV
jgi:hypothetical protein